jgi:hypothetical protein
VPPGRRCEVAERDRPARLKAFEVRLARPPTRRRERPARGLFDSKVPGDRPPDPSTRLVAISRTRSGRFPLTLVWSCRLVLV